MRLVFAGTPEFAATHLAALLAAGHQVLGVLTQPDRPAGRKLQLQASPVKQLALQHDLPLLQPPSLRLTGHYPKEAQQAHDFLQHAKAQALIVVAYGLILPPSILALQRCVNIHASLLPRWRGAAPIQRAIEAGDQQTGVCVMQMDAGLDTGPVWQRAHLPISADDTSARLHHALAQLGAITLLDVLAQVTTDNSGQDVWPSPQSQNAVGISYAQKLDKTEGALDFELNSQDLVRKIHAFNPNPGAYCFHQKKGAAALMWKCWQAISQAETRTDVRVGTILSFDQNALWVACRQGILGLREIQRAGGVRLMAPDFVRSANVNVGDILGAELAATESA